MNFSDVQIEDLTHLLATGLGRWNLSWLATSVLGIDLLRADGNNINSNAELAAELVKQLQAEGKIGTAMALLRSEAAQGAYISVGLNQILEGRRLDSVNLQKLLNLYEPFFNSAEFQRMLPRVRGVVCAVVVRGQIKGSGFLVGPDTVLTNFHVLDSGGLLEKSADEAYRQVESTPAPSFIFDYQSEPAPALDAAASKQYPCIVVPAAVQWLIHARRSRGDDGKATAEKDADHALDYVVVRLAKAVGERPSRASGGAMRGWLPLPAAGQCDYFNTRRVLIFQHPQGLAQQFDVGHFLQLDSSSTRTWYRVSAAHGSSGGAAVDSSGALFALHNASVDSPPAPKASTPGERTNQGVRIDRIAEDLRANAQWHIPTAPTDHHAAIWSLTEDIQRPRPIIGRRSFRDHVTAMRADSRKRVLTVIGEYGTFARFTTALLQRMLGTQMFTARFDAANMQTLPPQEFVRVLLEQIGVDSDPADPRPTQLSTETAARWLALDLPKWVARQLSRHEAKRPGSLPAWVVVNVTVPPEENLVWAAGLRDLVTSLIGVRDAGETVEIPQLRWLFLTTKPLPLGGAERLEENLNDALVTEEFVECMRFAWHAVEDLQAGADALFHAFASMTLAQNATGQKFPVRKALALAGASLIVNAPRR